MTTPPVPGQFIVFDGNEGCGKSTQIELLRRRLEADGVDVLAVRDPGTTQIGEQVRNILLDARNSEMGMRCEMLLYMSARAQMMAEIILPALQAGRTVICDRFVSSTLAYQLNGDGLSADEIRSVANIAIRGRWPDMVLLLDMPVERSMARVQRAKDRIEQRPAAYHEQVRQNFLSQAKHSPANHRVIDADRPAEQVHGDILQQVREAIKSHLS